MSVENPLDNNQSPSDTTENIVKNEIPIVKWKQLSPAPGPSPKPRHGHRAVALKDLIVVFGGGNDGIIDELHIFNTTTNTWCAPNIRGEVPLPCAAFGAAVLGTRILTFGGMLEYGRYSNDLHELQATRWEWKKLRPRAVGTDYPSARLGHSFVVSQKTSIAYVFGGLSNDSKDLKTNIPRYLDDLYIIDVSVAPSVFQWECPKTIGEGPTPRESHSAVIVENSQRRVMILYGGMNGSRLGDVWFLNLDNLSWTKMDSVISGIPPFPRSLHSAVAIDDKMYIYGGWIPMSPLVTDADQMIEKEWKCTNDLACLDVNNLSWQKLNLASYDEEEVPRPRAGHCAAAIGSRMYIWSGRDGYRKAWSNQVCCRDLWVMETVKPEQPGRVQLIRASFNSLDISWSAVPSADFYLLQMAPTENKPDTGTDNESTNNIKNGTPGNNSVVKVMRGQQVLRVVKQPTPNAPKKAIIISKEDGVTQKVVYLTNEVANVSDKPEPTAQSSPSIISTQGTTYTAPSSAQQTEEGTLPQNLFDESGAEDATSPSPAVAQEEQKADESSNATPSTNSDEKTLVDVKKEVGDGEEEEKEKQTEVKKEVEEQEEEKVSVKQEEDALEWFDIGLVKNLQCAVSHYFAKSWKTIGHNLDAYLAMNEPMIASNESVPKANRISLESGTSYRFRVCALNGLGLGAWSEVSTFKTCLPGFPSAPSSIRITKGSDGAQLTWEPPGNAPGRISEYSVYLAVKNSSGAPETQLAFMRVYVGADAECVVPQVSLQSAYVDQTNKPAIIFRIAARNEKGYGPATQVRWLQDQKPVIGNSSMTSQSSTPSVARFPVSGSPATPQFQYQHNQIPIKRARME